MTVLRCTAKLLRAMKAKPSVDMPRPSAGARLGDWTANLIQIGRIILVLVMNDRTRHLIVIDAAPYATVSERFLFALHRSLITLGVPAELAAEENARMQPVLIDSAKSRSVLSAINQIAWRLELEVRAGMHSAVQLTNHLSDNITTIDGKLDFPSDHVRKAFGLGKARRVRDLPDVYLH